MPAWRRPSKTFAKLSQLVGGTWVGEDRRFPVESRYEWAFGKSAIRGRGLIGQGSPYEQQIESILGLDPVKKTVYYLDFHGGTTVFQGTVKLEGEDLVFEFATVVGKPARWREVVSFPDKDTLQFTIFADKDGKWAPLDEADLGDAGIRKLGTDQVVDRGDHRGPGRGRLGGPGHEGGSGIVERGARRDRPEGRRQDADALRPQGRRSAIPTRSRTRSSPSSRIGCS